MDERGRCAGNVTLTRGRGSVELVKRGDEVWVKPDRDFWEAQLPGGQGTAAADTLHGRYVHGSTRDGVLAAVTEACDLDSLKEDLTGEATPDKGTRMTKGAATTAVFTPVIPLLRQEDGERVTSLRGLRGPAPPGPGDPHLRRQGGHGHRDRLRRHGARRAAGRGGHGGPEHPA